jgi:hypothetical protein
VQKIWPVAAVLAVPLILVLSFVGWLAVAMWEYEHRTGAALAKNFAQIEPGMRLEQINSLLGMDGVKIKASEIPLINDSAEPENSLRRIRRAVSGETYYKWRTKDGSYIIVSLRDGLISEKFLYVLSL